MARVDSLKREGKTSTLHFLSREAADEERRGVERDLQKLQASLAEKDKEIAERDRRIAKCDEMSMCARSRIHGVPLIFYL